MKLYFKNEIMAVPFLDRAWGVVGNETLARLTGVNVSPCSSLSATKIGMTGVLSSLFFSNAHSNLENVNKE